MAYRSNTVPTKIPINLFMGFIKRLFKVIFFFECQGPEAAQCVSGACSPVSVEVVSPLPQAHSARSSGRPRSSPARVLLLVILIRAGGTGAALGMMCLALYNPDVSWDRKNSSALGTNWVPMNRFYPVYMGCSNLKKDGPPTSHLPSSLQSCLWPRSFKRHPHSSPPNQETLLL